ncbi:uroporphyrin-III C-methyltransferase [Artomyces pyxidatus]|uniref:Uroporphyrin-III C-methyltransferase n=1 Tax=Artomyces pyxidatus TaxID=48021 RepID=A0ACB8TDR9_9AGAM|nr:uroporphyrin-III C-methyltransferase [Artomyces pyxidatus]
MQTAALGFPKPQGGASLLLAFRAQRAVIIVGSNQLAASRAFSALEADYSVTIVASGGLDSACEEIAWRVYHGQLNFVDLHTSPSRSTSADHETQSLAGCLDTLSDVSLLFVTDTALGENRRSRASAEQIHRLCRERRIPVNVTDMPELCDFTFASTHRFLDPNTHDKTPLQIAVVTNGQGCRLSGRLRRDIVAKLPREVGVAVAKVGHLRRLAKTELQDVSAADSFYHEEDRAPTPNRPVPQRGDFETEAERTRRRMKWIAQISEYWPYSRLAATTDRDMMDLLGEHGPQSHTDWRPGELTDHADDSAVQSLHALGVPSISPSLTGRIFLVGSGPGHPDLLTVATRDVLTKHADLILSDKLVPQGVLDLIPSGVEVRIARKFPGNSEGAQQELMEAAVEAASRGLTVVRLKQGDPTVYARAGEEVLYFRSHGYESIIIPGVSSALAGPVLAGIPVTQRGAAVSFTVCTGVGRQGKEVKLPGYDRGRTLIILMGVARLEQVVETLVGAVDKAKRDGPAYPSHTPIAIIERASMPDQRVITSTLTHIVAALESGGAQRPPGMMVVGWAVLSLWGGGDVSVLDDYAEGKDLVRVEKWLAGESWRVADGFDFGLDGL